MKKLKKISRLSRLSKLSKISRISFDKEKRRRLRKVIISYLIALIIVMLAIFFVVFYKYHVLESEIETYISVYGPVYGLIAIFVIAFIVDLLMQPIGPEIPLIAGIVSGINPILVVIFTAIGSSLASMTGYWLGKRYGAYGFKKFYDEKIYTKWRKRYLKNGNLVLAIAALSPVPYVPVCWISGTFEMKRLHFLFFGIVSRIARITAVAYLTYLFAM
ncbi:YqaA family protein [Thermoproteota archaeon]